MRSRAKCALNTGDAARRREANGAKPILVDFGVWHRNLPPHGMSATSLKRSEDFLKISEQFKLGALTTEGSHPVTADLSETARRDIPAALNLLFDVDADVIRTYQEFVASGRARSMAESVVNALRKGGKLFF